MFCTNCGAKLPDGAKFCGRCGTKVACGPGAEASAPKEPRTPDPGNDHAANAEAHGSSPKSAPAASAGAPGASAAPAPGIGEAAVNAAAGSAALQAASPRPAHRSRVPFVIAGVVVLIALGVIVALLVLPPKNLSVRYGTGDVLPCAPDTRIVPKDSTGSPLDSYRVSLASTTDFSRRFSPVEVEGSEGFTLDVFGDVPDDLYRVEVEEPSADKRYTLPCVDFRENHSSAPEEIDAQPQHEGEGASGATDASHSAAAALDSQRVLYAQYYDVCRSYENEYGTAGRISPGLSNYGTGLCLALLVDFDGSGTEELLLGYSTTDDPTTAFADEGYAVDVWQQGADGSVERVYQGRPDHSNGGTMFVPLYEKNGVTYLYATTYGDADEYQQEYPGSTGAETRALWTCDESGAFGVVSERVLIYASDGVRAAGYEVNGAQASQSEYDSAFDDVLGSDASQRRYYLVDFGENQHAGASELVLSDCAELTAGTIDELATGSVLSAEEIAAIYGGAAPSDGNGSDDASAAEGEVSYVVDEVEFQSAVPMPDTTGPGQTWRYPQFSVKGSDTPQALSSLNDKIKQSVEKDYAAAQEWNKLSADPLCVQRVDMVTYLEGSVAGLRLQRYDTGGGAHGWETVSGALYDLSTGQELAIEDAFGISRSDLEAQAASAINAYLEDNPSDIMDEEDLAQAIQGIVEDEANYYVAQEGIVVFVPPYALGSFAWGTREILAVPFNDDTSAGTDLSSEYFEKLQW